MTQAVRGDRNVSGSPTACTLSCTSGFQMPPVGPSGVSLGSKCCKELTIPHSRFAMSEVVEPRAKANPQYCSVVGCHNSNKKMKEKNPSVKFYRFWQNGTKRKDGKHGSLWLEGGDKLARFCFYFCSFSLHFQSFKMRTSVLKLFRIPSGHFLQNVCCQCRFSPVINELRELFSWCRSITSINGTKGSHSAWVKNVSSNLPG